jgi:hypothetical protein
MTITDYLAGLAIILGSLVGVLGLCAGILRHRASHQEP